MAIPITIPRLGWSMEEGIFLGWLKQDGEPVRAGEMLFRLESEKAAEEIECLDSGILRIADNAPKEGDKIPVGTLIGHLLQSGETGVDRQADPQPEAKSRSSAPAAPAASAARIVAPSPSTIVASPRARRLARSLGVDWNQVHGSGRNGRIRERDVRAAAPTSTAATTAAAAATARLAPLSNLRRVSADRLLKSVQSTVPVTLTTRVDVTNLVNLRQQFKRTASTEETVPSLTDFFVKLAALALQQHPLLTARWAEDHLVMAEEINIGIAVDTEAGLLVPVLQQVPELSLQELASRSRMLIERARQGKLTNRDLQGGVFTITNLGMYGVEAFTPIINHPECAILGIGCIRRSPVYVEDKVTPHDQLVLSLTFDHRIVDGAPAARFLQTLTQGVENPAAWFIRK